MIVSCPSCGTHYRHEARSLPVRARCGRCDAAIDRTGLRAYRIAEVAAHASEPRTGAPRAAVALMEPTPRAHGTVRDTWDESEPLPSIPEMEHAPAFEPSVAPVSEDDILDERRGREPEDEAPAAAARTGSGGVGTVVAWTTAGSVLGTGVSWTLGNTTMTGVLFGGLVGLMAAWGWLRWISRP